MTVSDTVNMALKKAGIRHRPLADSFGMSVSSMNNKFSKNSWSAADLLKVAACTGGRLALVYPDGQQILFDPPAEEPEAEG